MFYKVVLGRARPSAESNHRAEFQIFDEKKETEFLKLIPAVNFVTQKPKYVDPYFIHTKSRLKKWVFEKFWKTFLRRNLLKWVILYDSYTTPPAPLRNGEIGFCCLPQGAHRSFDIIYWQWPCLYEKFIIYAESPRTKTIFNV